MPSEEPSEGTDSGVNHPRIVVTIQEERPLPEGTSREEALEAARESFAKEIERAERDDSKSIGFDFRNSGGSDE